jgi:hypothetical protein
VLPVVDLRAVIDVEHMNNAAAVVEPVDAAIRATPGTVTTFQRSEQRPADATRLTASGSPPSGQTALNPETERSFRGGDS